MRTTATTSGGLRSSGPRPQRRANGVLNSALAAVAALTVSILAPAASAQTGPVVWTARSLQRIGPDTAASSGLQAQVYAARGEYESFQIVVRAPASNPLSNVNVTVSDLMGPGGNVIPKQNLALFREQFVNITVSSPNWGGANQPLPKGWYPDGLIPFVDPQTGQPIASATLKAVPFSLSLSKNQPIWVDVLVPRNAAAGQYTGTFTVTSDQGSVTGQITLTVWNFTLPVKPALKSSFLYWTAGSTPAIQELLRNRINPERTPAASQRSMIDSFGLSSQETGFWSGADISHCTMSAAPSVTQFANAAAAQQPDLFLYNYTADEIDQCTSLYPTMKQWAANMHQAGIQNLVTMAPVPELLDDGSGTGRSAVDIWVMLPVTYDRGLANVRTAQAKGDEAWSYNCLVQDSYSPKWMIDFAPVNFRVQPGFINQSLGLTGLLYWRVDDWSSDPWNNVYAPGFGSYPGEAILVYPGATVGIQGVAPSMRLKWLRDGADDYEYIDLLKKAGQASFALSVAAGVGANWSQWTKDIDVVENSRQQLGQLLDQLGGGSANPPGTPAGPSPANTATSVPPTPTLSWSAATSASSYDVYFGTSASPAMLGNTTATSYSAGTLTANTTYYWRVVAKNSGGSTSSATWSFTTAQSLPGAPANPSPANGATAVSQTPALAWSAAGGASSYDVYFGTSASPALAGNTASTSYGPGALSASTTYYWRVVAKNSAGSTSSATWSFTTTQPLPGAPAAPAPASGATGILAAPVLTWSAASNCSTYDVYFGSSASPALAGSIASTSYSPGTLAAGATYYWRVVARNAAGATSSATWSFTTSPQFFPATPINPSPTSGATGVTLTTPLAWSAASGASSYDVYFGTSASPALRGTATSPNYNPGTLTAGTTYYWRVVARNLSGSTSSATWSFTTAASSSGTTPAPVSVSPSSGAGLTQTFAFTYSVPAGLANANVLFNATANGQSACWFNYNASSRAISLASDNASAWSYATVGSATTLQNSQCSLRASGATVTTSGTNVTLTIPVTFKTKFAGVKNTYMRVQDTAGTMTAFAAKGTWTVR